MTAELDLLLNGQPPVSWWRNATDNLPPSMEDSRSRYEGLVFAMCLHAGNNAKYMREIISRRLLGLKIVLTDSSRTREERWRLASALLPLNGLSSISLPAQQLMERQARRAHKRSDSSSRSHQSTSSRGGFRRSRRGRGGRGYTSDGDGYNSGYNSGAERTQSSRGRGGGRGHRGGRGGNSHSGASSAPSNRGSSAGGSGAAQA
jgi:hypothetical protein